MQVTYENTAYSFKVLAAKTEKQLAKLRDKRHIAPANKIAQIDMDISVLVSALAIFQAQSKGK